MGAALAYLEFAKSFSTQAKRYFKVQPEALNSLAGRVEWQIRFLRNQNVEADSELKNKLVEHERSLQVKAGK